RASDYGVGACAGGAGLTGLILTRSGEILTPTPGGNPSTLTATSRALVSVALGLTTGVSAAFAFSTASNVPVSVISTWAGLTCHRAGSTPSPVTRTTWPGSLRVTRSSSSRTSTWTSPAPAGSTSSGASTRASVTNV